MKVTKVPKDIIIRNLERKNRKHVDNIGKRTPMGLRMYFGEYEILTDKIRLLVG